MAQPGPTLLLLADDDDLADLLTAAVPESPSLRRVALDDADAGALAAPLPDVAVLDARSPDEATVRFLAAWRRSPKLSPLPVLAIAHPSPLGFRPGLLRAGATDVLAAPVVREVLAARVRALAELSLLRRSDSGHHPVPTASPPDAGAARLPVLYRLTAKQLDSIRWAASSTPTGRSPQGRPTEPSDTSWLRLVHPADRPALRGSLRRLIEGDLPALDVHMRMRVGADEYVLCRHLARSMPGDGGIHGAVIELEAEAAAEQVRNQARDVVGRLTADLAHDFNNMLGSIVSFAGLLRDTLPPGESRGDAEEILRAAGRGARLTRILLSFTLPEPVEPQALDLNDALPPMQPMLASALPPDTDLALERAQEPAIVLLDPVQLEQILVLLLLGLQRSAPAGADSVVRVSNPSADFVALTLRSRLPGGVDAATAGIDARSPRHGKELAAVERILGATGGLVEARRDRAGLPEFFLRLPRCHALPATPADSLEVALVGEGQLVVVAEDDDNLRRSVQRVLTRGGYEVETAADGTEAIALLDRLGDRVDAVFSDVRMPGADGIAVLAHARRTAPTAARLLTSGYFGQDRLEKLPPGVRVLWKPVRPAALLQAFATALAARRPPRSRPAPPSRRPAPAPQGAGDPRTTSLIAFPASFDAAISAPSFPPSSKTAPPKILLVEDDRSIARALTRLLARQGYAVELVKSVADAAPLLEEVGSDFLAAVCDLGLSDGSLAPTLARLLDHRPLLLARIVVTTGGATSRDDEELLGRAGLQSLTKPLEPSALLAILDHLASA